MPTSSRQRPAWADDMLDLAAQEATGRFVVVSRTGEHGWIYLRDGDLTGISAAARRPLLSRRLSAFEVMPGDAVRKLLDEIRGEPGVRLLDVIVDQRLVPEAFVEDYLRNAMAEQMGVILDSAVAGFRFEPGRVQRVSPLLMGVHDILAAAAAVPQGFPADIADHVLLAAAGDHRDVAPIHRAVLTASDGHRRPMEVADLCGLTAAETLRVVAELQRHGLIEMAPEANSERWHGASGVDVPAPAPAPDEHRAASHVWAPPAAAAPETETAGTPARVFEAPPHTPPVKPFAPAPAEPEHQFAQRSGPDNRREALSVLKSLTEAVAADAEPPASHVPQTHEPQAEVTTTTPRVWSNRPARPADPMESGDVLRELKSLGDQ